jgi:hypothetical protein
MLLSLQLVPCLHPPHSPPPRPCCFLEPQASCCIHAAPAFGWLDIYIYICIYISLHIDLSTYRSIYLSIYLSFYLSIDLSIYLSISSAAASTDPPGGHSAGPCLPCQDRQVTAPATRGGLACGGSDPARTVRTRGLGGGRARRDADGEGLCAQVFLGQQSGRVWPFCSRGRPGLPRL